MHKIAAIECNWSMVFIRVRVLIIPGICRSLLQSGGNEAVKDCLAPIGGTGSLGSLVATWLLHHSAMQLLLLGRTGRGKNEVALSSQKGGYVLITIARSDVSASEEAAYIEYAGACTNSYSLQVLHSCAHFQAWTQYQGPCLPL